jgi:hypothetical protein
MKRTISQAPQTTNTDSNSNPPLRDSALAEPITDSQANTSEISSESGIPGKKARKYTAEELRQKLLDLGGRDATFDTARPRAFELPASGISLLA